MLSQSETAVAAERLRIPFVRYEANQKYVPTGEKWGWTTRFQNGALEELGKAADDGFLNAELVTPKGAGPFAFAILMHGCGGFDAIARRWTRIWAEYLQTYNVGSLILDSFTTRGVKSTCGSPDAHWSRRRVDDAYSALDFLVARANVNANQVYIMGRSNGGRAVLNALQIEYRAMRKNLFAGGISLYPHCAARKDDSFYAPLLILIAELDDANPSVHCRELGNARRASGHPELRVIEYPKALHGFDDGSPVRMFNGWRVGGNTAAAKDAKLQARAFLMRHHAISP